MLCTIIQVSYIAQHFNFNNQVCLSSLSVLYNVQHIINNYFIEIVVFASSFNSPLLLNPGDVLRTKCTFTSKTKVKTTYSGQATSDEMCFAFLVYYPKEAFDSLQCNTWNGIQICSLRSYTDVVDGCQIRSFLENTSMTTEFVAKVSLQMNDKFSFYFIEILCECHRFFYCWFISRLIPVLLQQPPSQYQP